MMLAKNLRYLRKKNDYSQDYVADRLGYKSYTTIQKWETGVSEPPLAKLKELSILFFTDMNSMLNTDLEKEGTEDEIVDYYYETLEEAITFLKKTYTISEQSENVIKEQTGGTDMPRLRPSIEEASKTEKLLIITNSMKRQRVDRAALARRLQISPRTLDYRLSDPDALKSRELQAMAKFLRLSRDDVLRIMGL